ncbi:unnamed protein product, partial [Meganyctiphanes norvegica]
MDDMQRVTSAACADLERLAAAAATMGYSSDKAVSTMGYASDISVSSHHLPSSNINQTAADDTAIGRPSIITQYTVSHNINPYDLSRPHHLTTVRLSEFPTHSIYDQTKSPHTTSVQHQASSAPVHAQITTIKNEHNEQQCSQYNSSRSSLSENPDKGQYSLSSMVHNSTTPHILFHDGLHYIESKSGVSSTLHQPLSSSSLLTASSSDSLTTVVSQPGVSFEREDIHGETTDHKSANYFLDKKRKKFKNAENKSEVNTVNARFSSTNRNYSDESEDPHHIDISKIPDPVTIDGRNYFVCKQCGVKFIRKYQFRRHQISHTGEKRGALSLETKVEVIKRIQGGEKQVDLAMEYNVGRSTLSFIMKNSERFLAVWKNGKFHPDSKRLRGAQREDVEEALYEWYKQALKNHTPVSGPILCMKAKDFAAKLGYSEFKATHGWLDRFKHRKSIVLGRGKNKDRDPLEEVDELKGDFAGQVLPSALMEFEANDVFHADEIGLLYRILPNKSPTFCGTRCAGGKYSKHRVTVLMCTNMTGTEKFPLLVIGKHPKPKCFKNVKSLPVQYLANPKSWMTLESFTAWLHDLDSWFVKQNRKVLLVLPNLPIHPKGPQLNAVRVITSPSKFVGPSRLGIACSLKRNYRRLVLESLLSYMEEENYKKSKKKLKKPPIKLKLLSCLHHLAAAWHAVSEVTINNSFQRSGISKYGLWGMNLMPDSNLGTENLELIHKLKSCGFKMPESFTFDDFVTFDDHVQSCHLMDDDNIIASVTGANAESSDSEEENEDEEDATLEEREFENLVSNEELTNKEGKVPTSCEVEAGLGTLRHHIKFQEGSHEMLRVLAHLEYLIQKPTLATVSID